MQTDVVLALLDILRPEKFVAYKQRFNCHFLQGRVNTFGPVSRFLFAYREGLKEFVQNCSLLGAGHLLNFLVHRLRGQDLFQAVLVATRAVRYDRLGAEVLQKVSLLL